MSLLTFLKESSNTTKVVIQQLMDNLDDAHLTHSSSLIKANIGQIIKNHKLSNLYLVIKQNKNKDLTVKLGKSKENDGEYAIVVFTPNKLPNRKSIDSFIARDEIYNEVSKELKKYFSNGVFSEGDPTNYELEKNHNDDDQFEEMYSKLSASLDTSIKDFGVMTEKLKRKYNSTNNMSEKQKLGMAIRNLQKETIGCTIEEFNKIVRRKFDEVGNMKMLRKDYKKKLDSRMESYYEQYVSPINSSYKY